MPWTNVTFIQDEDKDSVGTISATWDSGLATEFIYTERTEGKTAKNKSDFAVRANTAKDLKLTKKTKETSLQTQFLTELNK